MKRLKGAVTIALLLFVGATVGLLIAQEVTQATTEGALSASSLDGGDESGSAPSTSAMESTAIPAESNNDDSDRSPVDSAVAMPPGDDAGTPCVVDVIYFHNTHRCWTCQKIERDARTVVEAEYVDALADGSLRWLAINMEVERQYVDRYALTKPTLILVRRVEGEPSEWRALEETWALVRNETRFALYIGDSVGSFLEGCQ